MKTGKQCLIDNDKASALLVLSKIKKLKPSINPVDHAKALGHVYNRGGFENDEVNSVRRMMVELKILSVFGKHTCPSILLR